MSLADRTFEELLVGELYSNDEIVRNLEVSNAGGIRPLIKEGRIVRTVVMTSGQSSALKTENPYHDRLEGGILTYTAAGKAGSQILSGGNRRLIEQKESGFPIHGFEQIAGRRDKSVGPRRWRYLGLLRYLRHYQDSQLGSDGKVRQVWLFEFGIHDDPQVIPLALEWSISQEVFSSRAPSASGDDEVLSDSSACPADDFQKIEHVRRELLGLEPRQFELFLRDLLLHCGFADVCVTRFTADGGVDINARAGARLWPLANALIQVQAKRWLHSVGRKEIAELRGSLQPFAIGAVVTTSHFSKAAVTEGREAGKNPITLVDGLTLSRIVISEGIRFSGYDGGSRVTKPCELNLP